MRGTQIEMGSSVPLARKEVRERKPLTSNHLDMDRICRLLKVDTLEEKQEWLQVHAFGSVPDWTEEDEEIELTRVMNEYTDAVMHVVKDCFDKHGLELVAVRPKSKRARREWDADRSWEYMVVPNPGRSWRDAADNIRRTTNGVGQFEFATTREFLDSGPYTAREAVLQHLGWIPDWYEVYEGSKAASRVERRLR